MLNGAFLERVKKFNVGERRCNITTGTLEVFLVVRGWGWLHFFVKIHFIIL
jgi:hypothetical protein